MTTTHHDHLGDQARDQVHDHLSASAEGAALRTARDNLDETVTIPWPHDPVPEMLARDEALAALLPLMEPVGRAADHVLDVLRRDGRALAEVDRFGMLAGPVRARYLAIIAAVTL